MIFLYRLTVSLIYYISYPFLRILAQFGSEKDHWRYRLCLKLPQGSSDIWLHAASVGEIRLASGLVHYLKEKRPDIKIHCTVMTPAGFETALREFKNSASVSYYPFDFPRMVKKLFRKINPKIVAVFEGDLWPNLIFNSERAKVPVILLNGRMSEKSLHRVGKFPAAMRRLLDGCEFFFMKSEEDSRRYLALGARIERIRVVGDMKFDAPLLENSHQIREDYRGRVGAKEEDFLFVAGSTRPGEEEILADLFLALEKSHPLLKMVIAPRHLNRVGEISRMLEEKGIRFGIFEKDSPGSRFLLVDKMGLLIPLFAAANLAYVGGTMSDTGGHNVLEPVWAGTPVLFGPDVRNIRDSAAYLLENGFGAQVETPEELIETVREVLAGNKSFRIKKDNFAKNSPTVQAGEYILNKIGQPHL